MLRGAATDPKLYIGAGEALLLPHVVDIRDNSLRMDRAAGDAYISLMTNLGTRLFTMLRGRLIGTDADGRTYYQERGASRSGPRRLRRWVIYRPGEDASSVPAEWWNWLHYADASPLPPSVRKPWQLPFQPNRTGSLAGYRPPGSDYLGGHRRSGHGDYEAWTPDA